MLSNSNQRSACSPLAKKTTLVEFATWPQAKRQSFVRKELSSAPQFIVDSLLRSA